LEKRILVGKPTMINELRTEGRFGGIFGSDVVDRKSKNNLQEPK
jgi:hypothetical protein